MSGTASAAGRLQPSLLDRLTDNAPEKADEGREERVLSHRQLRASVLRDLSWLLNSLPLLTSEQTEQYPHVARSVLNFGIMDLAGRSILNMEPVIVETMISDAIREFEPRLDQTSLKVNIVFNKDLMSENALVLEITGDLWADPAPQRLFIRTQIDLERGSAQLDEG